jgi:PHP family Zn ribbon phosphoesterase
MHRVDELADRDEGFRPQNAKPYRSVIPLIEIIGEALGVGPSTKKAEAMYFGMLTSLGNEFSILLDAPISEIETAGGLRIAEAVLRMRSGDLSIQPGYDGEFGKIKIFERLNVKQVKGQGLLF